MWSEAVHARAMLRDATQAYRPAPDVLVSEHIEGRRILSPLTCGTPGPMRFSVTPWIPDIIDCYIDPTVARIVCQKSSQVAWTDGVGVNLLYYIMTVAPNPVLCMFPKDDSAQRFSVKKFDPMVDANQEVRAVLLESHGRDGGNTRHSKSFKGGFAEFVGSNSASNLADIPIHTVLIEEPDRCARDSGGREGSAIKLAIARTKTFFGAKVIVGGSPTMDGASAIQDEMALTDKRRYNIPCISCGHEFVPTWNDVQWTKRKGRGHPVFGDHEPENAKLKCPKCRYLHANEQKNRQVPRGRWIATAPFSGRAGFYLNELISTFTGSHLANMAADYLEAKAKLAAGDDSLIKPFINTRLGLAYKAIGAKVDDKAIRDRREVYTAEVPFGAVVLTAGVDVQIDRLEVEILGHGANGETWNVDYKIFYGDPYLAHVWKKLDDLLFNTTWTHECGAKMKVAAAGVDSGHASKVVYAYCAKHVFRHVYAVKGDDGESRYWKKSPVADDRPCDLYIVYSGKFKTDLYNSLSTVKAPGPNYHHFPQARDDTYFEQLSAEQRERKFRNGHAVYVWTKQPGVRNEALDCRVYASAAFMILAPSLDAHRAGLLQQIAPVHSKPAADVAQLQVHRSKHMERMRTR